MPSKGWKSKGDKSGRRSPRQRGRQCARPSKAPRSVTTDKSNKEDSEIQEITGTENARQIEGRQDEEPHVIPFIKGIKLMSEREATECAEHGEVLRWSPDSEGEQTIDKTPPESDTTGSTPEIFKSPELIQGRVPGSNTVEETLVEETIVEKTVPLRKYKGWVYIPETEINEGCSAREEDVPVASVIQPQTDTTLSLQQMQEFKQGPEGERAVGKTVAKTFDGVQFSGTVDSFRKVRQRYYYHVTYTDGDEEEMTQIELRDAYLLANTDIIEAEWDDLQVKAKGKEEVANDESSEGETSEGSEGSEYDRHDFIEEIKQTKRKNKTTYKRPNKRPTSYKRANKKRANDLSLAILPHSGDKTVAGEAYAKLDSVQQGLVKEQVNKKTKQVQPFVFRTWHTSLFLNLIILLRWRSNQSVNKYLTLGTMLQ